MSHPHCFVVCKDNFRVINVANCTGNLTAYRNGTCYDKNTGVLHGIHNKSIAEDEGINKRTPAEEYFRCVLFDILSCDNNLHCVYSMSSSFFFAICVNPLNIRCAVWCGL